ncbi:NACHT domain-containing NTPase [Lysinibacillus sp. BPa_S21]|uniref:NACHT domain-containing protein n=1 Tax=Lysinibacillus sp. BPa_S21 TaxID=2932478 RepID=UPI002012691C|nr:hypothetical protein [Lysinibacillus sp. BPa_S21]MCL1697331.1 hypothetical protein [Lysinibacillus sp. BPa_S21]
MYDWKRYWRHRGVTINYDSQGLFDESLNLNKICHLSDKEDEKLLVLLGEPGIGKSNTLFAEFEGIKHKHNAIFINLRDFIDRRWFEEKITETNDFNEWNQNERKNRLYLFLDAVDEAIIQSKQNVNNILDYLSSIDGPNLFIRTTCRSSEWPDYISSRLSEMLNVKKDEFEQKNILVLTPLTSSQISLALEIEQINFGVFWDMVKNARISSLTMHPYTLSMLLSLHKYEYSIPTSKRDLFSKGAEILCQEHNETRLFYNPKIISHSDLLEIAQILALLSIMSGNLNIINSTSIEKTIGYLELIKLQPQLEKKISKITFASLQQTLKSSLFIDMGQGLYTWSHKMIAEYLAAQAIITLKIDLEILKNLFVIRLKEYVSISREYLGVISWLLDERKDLLIFIIEYQPEILFEIEFEIPNELREKVIKNIFAKISITDYRSNFYLDNKYKVLYFDGIEELIKKKFEVGDNNAKLEALKIIQDCNLVKLYSFVEQAATEIKDYMVLKNIIKTLIQLTPSEKKVNALEYLKLEDPDDEIIGIVLNELWPNIISFKELLKNIRTPHNTSFLGKYRSLLYDLEKRDFTVREVLDFTEYIIENKGISDNYDLNKIIDRLYSSTIQLVHTEEYRDSIFEFIKVLLSDERNYEIYRYLSILNTENRRQLIIYLIRCSTPLKDYSWILKEEDIGWIIDNLLIENEGSDLLVIVINSLRYSIYDNKELVLKLYQLIEGTDFKSQIPCSLFDAWELEYYLSKQYKREYLESIEGEKVAEVSIPKIQELILEISSGKPLYWVKLLQNISLGNSIPYEKLNLNFNALPEKLKSEIIEQAKSNLEIDINIKEYLGKNRWSYYETSLFYIFNFVFENEKEYVSNLSNETLRKWLAIIINAPIYTGDKEKEQQGKILDFLYDLIREEFNEISKLRIDIVNKSLEYPYRISEDIKKYGNQVIFDYLKDILYKHRITNKKLYQEICRLLISEGHRDIISFLKKEILKMSRLDFAILTAEVLLEQNEGWEYIFPQMLDYPMFCNEMLLVIAKYRMRDVLSYIPKRDYLLLYQMLENSYPNIKLDKGFTNGYMGKDDHIHLLKNSLLNALVDEATIASYRDIETLKQKFNMYSYWGNILQNARETYFSKNPIKVNPEDFITILMNSNSRIVETEEELVNVLMNVLNAVQSDLYGENSELFLLWIPNGNYIKPRGENEFSTYLINRMKHFIERYNVILNREVEWRPSRSSSEGERTDIHVNAKGTNGNIITCIIEVKGNWNKELKTAMDNQLADRYLKDSSTRSGIYLVAWFESEEWKKDYRKSQRPIKEKQEAIDFFNNQSEELNKMGYYIKPYVMNLPF